MKVVINKCFGGFGLSDAAYKKLIELGIPCRPYNEQQRGSDGRFLPEPLNEGQVIFVNSENSKYASLLGTYWDSFLSSDRSNPLLVRVIEELGDSANGRYAKLKIVEIPDGTDYEISEYDGMEHVSEKHRTWG